MTEENTKKQARDTRNEGLEKSNERLHDPDQRPPHQAVDRDAGAVDSQNIPDNTSEQDPARLENPPQVNGPRERNNDAV